MLKTVQPSLMAVGVVVALFLSSEHIIKKENNFIRRFGQHPIRDEKAFDLGVNSYYFAGIVDGQIYLGNVTAPLTLTAVDTALTTKKDVKIQLDHIDHPFRSIRIKVKPPCFYLYDGSVPVIYREQLGDSLARTVSFEDGYFSQLEVIDSLNFAFRTQSADTKAQVQVRSLSDGRHQMGAPPMQVNKRSAVHNRVLFNESNLMGKFESREMWNRAAIIDMYRTDRQEYQGSFYVPDRGGHTIARIIVTDKHLFVLSGNEIVRYRFAQSVTRHFNTGEAENLN